ncbi:MAG: biotin carboxylase N-terminal domain-containing protein [Acidimicrobiales bacterium]
MTAVANSIGCLLVANRGEIARRVFRTAHSMGMRTVAVYVAADADALHVADADMAVEVPSYLDADAILAAARATRAGAVHPGYGYLSENPTFAQAVADAGLVWVGPPPAAIVAMGDKIEAKKWAVDAGVPVLGSSDDPDVFESVGFPLLIKAAAGGGGKGMRIVEGPDDLTEAVAAARREAATGFGDDRVFAERYVPRARHIEVQIVGDQHGNVVHLGERECSIQRRHQKIIEEAPSPYVDEAMRSQMGEAAVALARAIGYTSTGTVEFLVDDETGEFFFLEVNTRLQVEHPVTEVVTGIDLVRTQLRVAQGQRLEWTQDEIDLCGHAIEARLYAEDPANGFLPATGTIEAFEFAQSPAVRIDTGVGPGSVVGTDFDPMIAKVIAGGPTRQEAVSCLASALERAHIGGVVTNRDLLVATLRTPEFGAADTTTDFIDRVGPSLRRQLDDATLQRVGVQAALWLQASNRESAPVLRFMPSGFRTGRLPAPSLVFDVADGSERRLDVSYQRRRNGDFHVRAGELTASATVFSSNATSIDVAVDGVREIVRVTRSADSLHLTTSHGTVTLAVVPLFAPPEVEMPAGALTAPMPGRVVEVRVAQGEPVTAGEVLVVLEAMKMEHHLRAPYDGVAAEVRVAAGDQVDNGALLMVIEDA